MEEIIEQRPQWLKVGYVLQIIIYTLLLGVVWLYSSHLISDFRWRAAWELPLYHSCFAIAAIYSIGLCCTIYIVQKKISDYFAISSILFALVTYFLFFGALNAQIVKNMLYATLFCLLQIGFSVVWLVEAKVANQLVYHFKWGFLALIAMYSGFIILLYGATHGLVLKFEGLSNVGTLYLSASFLLVNYVVILILRIFREGSKLSKLFQFLCVSNIVYVLFEYSLWDLRSPLSMNFEEYLYKLSATSIGFCIILGYQHWKTKKVAPQSSDPNLLDDFE